MGKLFHALLVLWLQFECCNMSETLPAKVKVDDRLTKRDFSRLYASDPKVLQDCKGSRDTHQMTYTKRLQSLRKEMTANYVTSYILLGIDLYQREDKSQRANIIDYLTGYVGKFSAVIISEDDSTLFLDMTYNTFYEVPLSNLSCSWKVGWIESRWRHLDSPHNTIVLSAPFRWLLEQRLKSHNISSHNKIGFSSRHMPIHAWNEWLAILNHVREANEIVTDEDPQEMLIGFEEELIAKVWDEDDDYPRPPRLPLMTYHLKSSFTGQDWRERIQKLRQKLTELRATAIFVTEYDETSYLLNFRSNMFHYSSLVEANVIVDYFRIWIFNASTVNERAYNEFDKENIGVVFVDMYDSRAVEKRLNMISDQGVTIVTKHISYFLYKFLNESNIKLIDYSPVRDMMMEKSKTERRGMYLAALRNAYTYLSFMAGVSQKVQNKTDYSEYQALVQLVYSLRQNIYYRGQGEPAISAFGTNTAKVGYGAKDISANQKSKSISTLGLYLVDTSNHYLDGTTAIGRTFHFGTPLKKEMAVYTRLLQGTIQLAMTHFPPTVTDNDLESILLGPLYGMGLATTLACGHGIGAFTTVREPPIRIRRKSIDEVFVPLRPGMMLSFESQYYHGDEFGIKIKNTFEVIKSNLSLFKSALYTFQPVTYFPFEENLIVDKLLSVKEKRWLNGYYDLIRRKLGNFAKCQKDKTALEFLNKRLKKKFDVENPECVPRSSSQGESISASKSRRCMLCILVTIWCLTLVSS